MRSNWLNKRQHEMEPEKAIPHREMLLAKTMQRIFLEEVKGLNNNRYRQREPTYLYAHQATAARC